MDSSVAASACGREHKKVKLDEAPEIDLEPTGLLESSASPSLEDSKFVSKSGSDRRKSSLPEAEKNETAKVSESACSPKPSAAVSPGQGKTVGSSGLDASEASSALGQREAEGKEAAVEKSSSPVAVQWPWIPLVDNQNRTYYYNALTSKTSWTCDASSKESSVPPSAYTAATAQKAWHQFWSQCQQSQNHVSEGERLPGSDVSAPKKPTESRSCGSSMAVYLEHFRSPTAKELGRPARQQVRPPSTEAVGYVQGFDEYNIWYGKYLSDRREGGRREDREKATTRCNPFTDSGWTRCDMEPELDRPVICLYFAKGCCYLGSQCRYYHRLPTVEDNNKLDMLHDIFGRERFAAHRDDMGGVGTFSEDCRTLFVGDLKVNRVYPNAEEKTEELIRQQFGLWGPLEDIRVIRNKNIAFVRYKYRAHAEFAKVAMAEQRLLLDRPDDQISIRWAHPGRDSSGEKKGTATSEEWESAHSALMKRFKTLGYSQDEINCYLQWNLQQEKTAADSSSTTNTADQMALPISSYPNTDARLPHDFQHLSTEQQTLYRTTSDSQPEASPGDHNVDNPVVLETSSRLDQALSRIQTFSSEDVFKVEL